MKANTRGRRRKTFPTKRHYGASNNVPNGAGMEISAVGDIPEAGSPSHRAAALDILRGIAVLMMVFSGGIPYDKPLPRWLFHAQEPPTLDLNHAIVHIFDPTLPGLTFVDLVFPLFLFALGAAIPLALSKRLNQGAKPSRVIAGGFLRLLQLAWFAVYIGNIRPVNLHDVPNTSTWIVALIGYALLYPMFVRLPEDWSAKKKLAMRILGYGGGAVLLSVLSVLRYYPQRLGFQFFRVDVIIVALGDMAFFGTAIWVLTRGQLLQRLGVLAILLAIRLGASEPGWLHDVWTFAPKNTGWIFAFDYLKYLFLVVPGTIAGDLVESWSRSSETKTAAPNRAVAVGYIALTLLLVAGVLAGFEARKLWETAAFCAVVVTAMNSIAVDSSDRTQSLAHQLTRWGSYWLLLGVFLQPFEGGIKKDPSTLSYYFTTGGLAFFILAALLLLTSTLKVQRQLLLLAYSGQNPMIAYVSMANFILPVFALTQLLPILNRLFSTPWSGVLLSALETLLLAFLVGQLSQRKLFWRT